jgi:hypothetical protein
MVREFVKDEGNRWRERRRLLLFCDGIDNGYADDDCNGNNDNNDWLLFASSKQWDDSGDYIIFFIFNDNAREILLATKVMGGGRGKAG